MKNLAIEDDLVPAVVGAIAGSAKYFDNAIDANQYGNLSASAETIAEWQKMSDRLWALVRALGNHA